MFSGHKTETLKVDISGIYDIILMWIWIAQLYQLCFTIIFVREGEAGVITIKVWFERPQLAAGGTKKIPSLEDTYKAITTCKEQFLLMRSYEI